MPLSSLSVLAVVLSVHLAAPLAARAEDPPAEKKAPAADEAAAKKKKDELPSVEDAVEGMDQIDGVITLYRKKDRLLGLVPNDKLGKPMILATSIAGGGFFTGWQWSDMMIKFERHDKQVLVLRPDTQHVARQKGPISDAVSRTHPGYLVGSVPILGADRNRGVVIDLTDLYVKQAPAFIGPLAQGRDPSLAQLRTVKNFPHNAEVAVDLVSRPKGFEHGEILTVHYSLSSLPDNDYVPRLADDRVGYFLTVARDYTKDYLDDTTFVRFVNRWRLEKADPSLELSPPKEPIVFYIEKTVPTRYRRWVRDGIAEWNRAFERVGFVGAVEVRQQTETQFADLDPEDVRYNFFRWITSDASFAMGPSRVDPRTGQILDADIIFDDSMLRANLRSWDLWIEDAIAETLSPEDVRFLDDNPDWHPIRPSERSSAERPTGLVDRLAELRPSGPGQEPFGSGRSTCSIGRGRTRELALAALHLGLIAQDSEGEDGEESEKERHWPEEFVGQVIKETVMHEVGHTLGLRHNFKASSWRPMGDINPAEGGESHPDIAGSVMDYNPLNIAPDGRSQGNWQMTTIGPYDYWAIEYGYTTTGAKSPDKEVDALRAIAARSAEPGHDYATDEDIPIGDPLTNRWDSGSDPMVYARERIELCRKLKGEIIDRVVDEGASYAAARQGVDILLGSLGRAATYAANFVGGTYFHRDHRDDPDGRDPIVVVPVEKQREALALISDNLFAPDALEMPADLLSKLAPSRWSHWGADGAYGEVASYPYHDRVLSMQSWSLYRLMSPGTLRRVMDNELAIPEGEDALTIPELFQELTGSIFAELEQGPGAGHTNRKPFLTGMRRNLQREYVSHLTDLSLRPDGGYFPRAARTQAWYELRGLEKRLGNVLDGSSGANLDDYSRAHLEETHERITRALEASFQLGG